MSKPSKPSFFYYLNNGIWTLIISLIFSLLLLLLLFYFNLIALFTVKCPTLESRSLGYHGLKSDYSIRCNVRNFQPVDGIDTDPVP